MAHADQCGYLWMLDEQARDLRALAWRLRNGALVEPVLVAAELERMADAQPSIGECRLTDEWIRERLADRIAALQKDEEMMQEFLDASTPAEVLAALARLLGTEEPHG